MALTLSFADMSRMEALLTALKLGVVAVPATLPAAAYMVPMWGTTPSTFVLSGIGAGMSYAWDKREDNGFGLLFKAVSVTLFSVACVVVLPDLFGWELQQRAEPPLGFILALFGRHIIPALRHAAPNFARGIVNALSSRANSFNESDYRDFPDDARPGDRERDIPRNPDDDRGY